MFTLSIISTMSTTSSSKIMKEAWSEQKQFYLAWKITITAARPGSCDRRTFAKVLPGLQIWGNFYLLSTIIIMVIPTLQYYHQIYTSSPLLSSYSSMSPLSPHLFLLMARTACLKASCLLKDSSNGHLSGSHLCLGQGQAGHHHHQGDDYPHACLIVSLARHTTLTGSPLACTELSLQPVWGLWEGKAGGNILHCCSGVCTTYTQLSFQYL